MTSDNVEQLSQTPLDTLHRELGAKMVPFAGYELPLQYGSGIMSEHRHTRDAAGLFDVSHMGQIRLSGPNASTALESLVPIDVIDLPSGRQRYGYFTNEQGGILDDLMIAKADDDVLMVVNAARKAHDVEWLHEHIGTRCDIELLDTRTLLALQGPHAARVLERMIPNIGRLPFMHITHAELGGVTCWISRSGYTGEDGFEISIPATHAEDIARRLLAEPKVAPVGLGARDSLRLEAGLCLYGHDIDSGTTPVEAGLAFALARVRRRNGSREGGFPGAEVILDQMPNNVARCRVGIRAQGRGPVREGTPLIDADANAIGTVTSGGFGPTVDHPVAMGYVPKDHRAPGTKLNALVRDKVRAVEVSELPFVAHRYYR